MIQWKDFHLVTLFVVPKCATLGKSLGSNAAGTDVNKGNMAFVCGSTQINVPPYISAAFIGFYGNYSDHAISQPKIRSHARAYSPFINT
jgi:hypothetical protein